MKKPITSSLLLISMLLLCLLTWHVTAVHAAGGDGQISGQVMDGSNKNAPVAQQTVTLQLAQGSATRDAASVKTDMNGNFTFPKLFTDQTITYVVYTRFQNAQYVSDAITLGSKPFQVIKLQVYQSTQSTTEIAVTQATILIRQPDPAKGVITVSQVFTFQNLNTKTYVGSLNASKGKPNALFFSLPTGVRNITLGSGFSGYQVLQVNSGFASDAALLPGTNSFSYSYEVPYTTADYTFSYETQYPTVSLSFLIDPDLHASSKQLTSAGIINADSHSYHAYKATVLPTHSQISIALEGLPLPRNGAGSPSFNAGIIWLIAGVFVLLAVLVMTVFLLRAQRNRAGKPVLEHQHVTDGRASAVKITPVAGKTVVTKIKIDPQQALLQELLQLDEAYASGTLTKVHYEEQRSKTKARLRVLISEQERVR